MEQQQQQQQQQRYLQRHPQELEGEEEGHDEHDDDRNMSTASFFSFPSSENIIGDDHLLDATTMMTHNNANADNGGREYGDSSSMVHSNDALVEV